MSTRKKGKLDLRADVCHNAETRYVQQVVVRETVMRTANSQNVLTVIIASCIIALCLPGTWLAAQELLSGVYATVPGAMMEECGDQIITGSGCEGFPSLQGRLLPLSATITLDLDSVEPTVSAVIHNAVLEGGQPFELEVSSSNGQMSGDGHQFFGDYFPPNPGYLFDWEFSPTVKGSALWNGAAFWSGGHIWQLSFDDVALVLVPEPCIDTALLILCALLMQRKRPLSLPGPG